MLPSKETKPKDTAIKKYTQSRTREQSAARAKEKKNKEAVLAGEAEYLPKDIYYSGRSDGLVVTEHNDLLVSSDSYSPTVSTMIKACLSLIDSRFKYEGAPVIHISRNELADLTAGVKGKSGKERFDIFAKELRTCYYRIENEDNIKLVSLSWAQEYNDRTGVMSIHLTPLIAQYTTALTTNFTSYSFDEYRELKNKETKMLYKLITMQLGKDRKSNAIGPVDVRIPVIEIYKAFGYIFEKKKITDMLYWEMRKLHIAWNNSKKVGRKKSDDFLESVFEEEALSVSKTHDIHGQFFIEGLEVVDDDDEFDIEEYTFEDSYYIKPHVAAYADFGQFNRRKIKDGLSDITTKTKFNVTSREVRTGRKVTDFVFTVERKQNLISVDDGSFESNEIKNNNYHHVANEIGLSVDDTNRYMNIYGLDALMGALKLAKKASVTISNPSAYVKKLLDSRAGEVPDFLRYNDPRYTNKMEQDLLKDFYVKIWFELSSVKKLAITILMDDGESFIKKLARPSFPLVNQLFRRGVSNDTKNAQYDTLRVEELSFALFSYLERCNDDIMLRCIERYGQGFQYNLDCAIEEFEAADKAYKHSQEL